MPGQPITDFSPEFLAEIELRRHQIVEAAGVLWLVAELAILFILIAAKRHLYTEPLAPQFSLAKADKRTASKMIAAGATLITLTFGRYLTPLSGSSYAEGVSHFATWTVFITLWVLLETGIVYSGWRCYRRLTHICSVPTAPSSGPFPVAALIIILALAFNVMFGAAAASLSLASGPTESYPDLKVIEALVSLYLRIAGIAWIAAEWVAAVLLWKSYRLLGVAIGPTRENTK